MPHLGSWSGELVDVVFEIGPHGQMFGYDKMYKGVRSACDEPADLLVGEMLKHLSNEPHFSPR